MNKTDMLLIESIRDRNDNELRDIQKKLYSIIDRYNDIGEYKSDRDNIKSIKKDIDNVIERVDGLTYGY